MYDLQKASMWRRISAALCDLVAVSIVAVGFAVLISTLLGYDARVARLEEISEAYETEYGVDFDISNEDYSKLSEGEQETYGQAMDAFSRDVEANQIYSLLINFTFATISISILIAFLLLQLLVPLLFRNGQTLGKKIFGVAVMRDDGVKLEPMLLFVREILGRYTLETMLPVLLVLMIYFGAIGIVGTITIAGMLILQLVLLCSTSKRQVLHDKIAHTVTVEYDSQKIFDSVEDMLAYKKRIHEEQVESERD